LSQEDIGKSFQTLSTDIELMRKNLNDLEMRKCDKKDLLDSKQKMQMSLDNKIDKAEISNVISDFTQD